MSEAVLRIRDLSVAYRSGKTQTEVLHDVSLDVRHGRVVGLVGESGSGKSTLALAALGWRGASTVYLSGAVHFEDVDLLRLSPKQLRAYWGKRLAYVPQEVAVALNPARRALAQLEEPLILHTSLSKEERRERIAELLERVRVSSDERFLSRYPFEFSGGQQQRIALVLAMICRPAVLVLDEPTTGIDATARVDVLTVLRELLAGEGTAVVYISHDLAETASLADELAVMYAGQVVERGPAQVVFSHPRHPYGAALRAAVPTVEGGERVSGIPGRPPGRTVVDRCAFADRCEFREDVCVIGPPPVVEVGAGHEVRCARVASVAGVRRLPVREEPAADARDAVTILEIEDLVCRYGSESAANAVDGVTLAVDRGETLAIVGESGSGKSTLLQAIAGLHPAADGTMTFEGDRLTPRGRDRGRELHRTIQLVFQNPGRSLNPRHSVERILDAPLRVFRPDVPGRNRRAAAAALLADVQLSPVMLDRYPHQLSGGEKQRVALARAFAARPSLLLCDEVVSALDVSVQASILELIASCTAEAETTVLFVTHDLAVARLISDRIAVLRHGRLCELAETNALFERPTHPYTRELLASTPETIAS